MNGINVVYAMTHHVYEWILPSLQSLAETNPDVRVFILAEDDELPFELPIRAEIINVSDQTYFPEDGANYHNSFTYINLLKVMYPTILPVDRVLHLDIDTIICDDLTELWNTDIGGKWFAACNECQTWHRPFGRNYYNMGVALINLKQMREDGIERAMQHSLNTEKLPFADQEAWNMHAYGKDKAVVLPTRWNESIVTGMTNNPGIVHFCGYKDWFTRPDMPRIEYLNRYRKG